MIYHCVSPFIIAYRRASLSILVHLHSSLLIAIHHGVSLRIAIHSCLSSCFIEYHYTSPFIIAYRYSSLNIIGIAIHHSSTYIPPYGKNSITTPRDPPAFLNPFAAQTHISTEMLVTEVQKYNS
ncbi:hypothetical protein CDAR_611981 [Caerostris darwini]|uniref:Uncharacterized protein n=1 Tax=Caerostris darwini TaxID=1538125 RepID=A0AAV4MVN7_9ARAC|nr:hypothetical protein CDAR_611981 [Caerostris darwini]